MNHTANYCLLLTLLSGAALAQSSNSYWKCLAQDETNTQWAAKNSYQKMAFHLALAACKKASSSPASCKISYHDCEGFNQGISTRIMWQCTALDRIAQTWQSNFYLQRDDAALAAKAFCKEKSSIPDTCYIPIIGCKNNRQMGL